jgi:outer membrane protein TolC
MTWQQLSIVAVACAQTNSQAQPALGVRRNFTWDLLREKLPSRIPTLLAARVGVEKSRAQEATAYLCPNRGLGASLDQPDLFPGPYDFNVRIVPLEALRQIALEARPDLKAAMQSVDRAKTEHRLDIKRNERLEAAIEAQSVH